MQILYFADIRFPLERANGIQTMQTCWALAARGHRVALVVRPDAAAEARDPFAFYGLPLQPHLTIERLRVAGPPAARRLAYLMQAGGRALGRRRADVALTRDLGVAALLLSLPRAWRPPVAYESHGFAPEVGRALGNLLTGGQGASPSKQRRLAARERQVWRAADAYVTITSALASELAAMFGDRKAVAVVPDGVRLPADHRFVPPPARTAATVAYAGNLYPWKGVEILLRALTHLPDVRGLVIGGHPLEPDLGRLKTLADELGLGARVAFTGHVAPSDVAAALADADVLVVPNTASAVSERHTSPLKLFEYLAAGRPIVASDLPSLREVLRDGVNAILVPAGDVRALAHGLRRVLDDADLGQRLARAAFECAADYSWDRRAERLEAALEAARGERS